jgi:hypothetical protein
MDVKLLDFSSLFQVALGINLAVPFFPDAIARPLSPVRQTLQGLVALQSLVPETQRGEYLGEVAKVRRDFQKCEDDIKKVGDELSVFLIVIAIFSFGVLYFSALDQSAYAPCIANVLLSICFIPPIGAVIALYLYSSKRSTDVRLAMQMIYANYIEKAG